MTQWIKYSAIFLCTATLVACSSKTFAPNAMLGKTEGGAAAPITDPVGATLQDVDLQGEIEGGLLDKTQVVGFNKTTAMFEIRIPIMGFTVNALPAGIPNVPGSKLSVVYDPNSAFYFILLEIPGSYVLGKLGFNPGDIAKDPTKLPNGNHIPQTPGGEPPAISFVIPNVTPLVQVYLGLNIVGVYIESRVNPYVDFTFPIQNRNKLVPETIGYFSTIAQRTPYLGGFFVSFLMPSRIARLLDDFLSKYITGAI